MWADVVERAVREINDRENIGLDVDYNSNYLDIEHELLYTYYTYFGYAATIDLRDELIREDMLGRKIEAILAAD